MTRAVGASDGTVWCYGAHQCPARSSYEEPVPPADLAGRAAEPRTLLGRAIDGRNSRLEGPRRFGKTSLLRAVSPRGATQGLLDRLALPRRVQERTGRSCVIAFDEFQEVVRIDARLPGVLR